MAQQQTGGLSFEEAFGNIIDDLNDKDEKTENQSNNNTYRSNECVDPKLYQLLGVPVDATKQEITKAFHKKAREFHPDRHFGKSDNEIEQLSLKFSEIHYAYETLSDPTTRAQYNKFGDLSSKDSFTLKDITKYEFNTLFDFLFDEDPKKLKKCEDIDVDEAFYEANGIYTLTFDNRIAFIFII